MLRVRVPSPALVDWVIPTRCEQRGSESAAPSLALIDCTAFDIWLPCAPFSPYQPRVQCGRAVTNVGLEPVDGTHDRARADLWPGRHRHRTMGIRAAVRSRSAVSPAARGTLPRSRTAPRVLLAARTTARNHATEAWHNTRCRSRRQVHSSERPRDGRCFAMPAARAEHRCTSDDDLRVIHVRMFP